MTELSRRVQRDFAMISRFALTYVGQRDTKAEVRVRKALGVPHAQEVRGQELEPSVLVPQYSLVIDWRRGIPTREDGPGGGIGRIRAIQWTQRTQ